MEENVSIHCPRWAELPGLGLYMDQVLLVLSESLAGVHAEEPVTAAMIGNYVKMKLLPPSKKKKYEREHLARLVMISLFKHVLSMAEIARVLSAMGAERAPQETYDAFCAQLEACLAADDAQPCALPPLADAAIRTLSHKLRFERMLAQEVGTI